MRDLLVVLGVLGLLLLFVGCEVNNKELPYSDLSNDSAKVVNFKYRINYVPPLNEYEFLQFAVVLLNNTYAGDEATINFKSGDNYEIDIRPINFVFQDRETLLGVFVKAEDLSEPIYLQFEGWINNSEEPVEFRGAFKINR